MENHNSVLGIREYALGKGASACAVDIEEAANQPGQLASSGPFIKVKPRTVQTRNTSKLQNEESRGDACNLFAFPSECNFTGLRFNLDLVNLIKENNEATLEGTPFAKSKRWMVLIDAAKGCATQPPNLSEFPADFVVMSFYKMLPNCLKRLTLVEALLLLQLLTLTLLKEGKRWRSFLRMVLLRS